MDTYSRKKGIIGLFFLVVIILLTLGYFGLDVQKIINSPGGQKNIAYAGGAIKSLWFNYFFPGLILVYDKLGHIGNTLWNLVVGIIQNVRKIL